MRKYILVSILGGWMMQSPIQAEVLETLSDSANVREAVTQTVNIAQIQTKYIPPALSLERKSLRIINMQGAAGLPKGEWEMFIQHRFGTFGTGATIGTDWIKVICALVWMRDCQNDSP